MVQVFMVLSKRVVGAKQKNRRCFLKEATMLRGSSQYTLRNQLTGRQREAINSIHEYLHLPVNLNPLPTMNMEASQFTF